MTTPNISMCNINRRTGYCEYCGATSEQNQDTGEWYCIALENELKNPQYDDESYNDEDIPDCGKD